MTFLDDTMFGASTSTVTLDATFTAAGTTVTNTATITLTKNPNPYILHGDQTLNTVGTLVPEPGPQGVPGDRRRDRPVWRDARHDRHT